MLAAAAACGGADDQEVSAVGDGSASHAEDSTGEDLPEALATDEPTGDGETSSASSADDSSDGVSADDATAASPSSAETDDPADLDDAVTAINDGSGAAAGSDDGQYDDGGQQPVSLPDGTKIFGPQRGEREPAVVTSVQPVVRESWPLQLAVIIAGELRDGCQELAWQMTPDGTVYSISVWQVPQDIEIDCTMAIVPFETQIELGTSETEDFTVVVNGESY